MSAQEMDRDDDALAGEYVLRVLDGDELAAFRARLRWSFTQGNSAARLARAGLTGLPHYVLHHPANGRC